MNIPSTEAPLILVVGSPRSGTTWLGKIFDSHPETFYRNEPESEMKLEELQPPTDDEARKRNQRTLHNYLEHLPRMHSTNVAGSLPIFRKQYESYVGYQMRRACIGSAKYASTYISRFPIPRLMSNDQIRRLRTVWKSLPALRQCDTFLDAMPPVNVVHIVRHPGGALASRLRGQKNGHMAPLEQKQWQTESVQQMLDTEAAEGIRVTSEELKTLSPSAVYVLLWALSNSKAMKDIEHKPGCLTIRYEDLCANPVDTSKKLFAHVGLPWHDQAESFLSQSTSHDSTRYYSVFKNPERAANRWREELPETEQQMIAELVGNNPAGRLFFSDDG